MARPILVTYEPLLAQERPTHALLNPATDEFDDALQELASSVLSKRAPRGRPGATDVKEKPQARSHSAIPALVATGAIAATGYQFVLRAPEDPKLRPWWYARFPTF